MFKLGTYNGVTDTQRMADDLSRFGAQIKKRLYLEDGPEPETPKAGGVLYVESGELRYKGSDGSITIIGMA